jgi:hypothetical protein
MVSLGTGLEPVNHFSSEHRLYLRHAFLCTYTLGYAFLVEA